MKRYFIILLLMMCSILRTTSAIAATPGIIGPHMEIIDNNIIVNLSIDNVAELEKTIKSGIEKEIAYTVELLRVWKFWPDEFVVSKRIEKVIKYDNLRDQYRASSYDGVNRIVKHFNNYKTTKDWIFNINAINLANIRELDPSSYYIRIVVESKSLEQLPLIGFLMHFIPEVEMSLAKESQPFIIKDK
jgi:hypothetical protein